MRYRYASSQHAKYHRLIGEKKKNNRVEVLPQNYCVNRKMSIADSCFFFIRRFIPTERRRRRTRRQQHQQQHQQQQHHQRLDMAKNNADVDNATDNNINNNEYNDGDGDDDGNMTTDDTTTTKIESGSASVSMAVGTTSTNSENNTTIQPSPQQQQSQPQQPQSHNDEMSSLSSKKPNHVGGDYHGRGAPPTVATNATTTAATPRTGKCTVGDCDKPVRQGGLCSRHGAKRKHCNQHGCMNISILAGLCNTHGAARKQCDYGDCDKVARQGGRCYAHGAKQKQCDYGDCDKVARQGGRCHRHRVLKEEQKAETERRRKEKEKIRDDKKAETERRRKEQKETAERKAKETAERKRKRKENREVRLSSSSSSSCCSMTTPSVSYSNPCIVLYYILLFRTASHLPVLTCLIIKNPPKPPQLKYCMMLSIIKDLYVLTFVVALFILHQRVLVQTIWW